MNKSQLLTVLRRSVREWNDLRAQVNSESWLDLRNEDLAKLDLQGANLSFADLSSANFRASKLSEADLSYSDLKGATLTLAKLSETKFIESNCDEANFTQADLTSSVFADTTCRETLFQYADLSDAYFGGCDCTDAVFDHSDLQVSIFSNTKLVRASLFECRLSETVLTAVDLSEAHGLDKIQHEGFCAVDFRTLRLSNTLPRTFLRGVGFPDQFIDLVPSFVSNSGQFNSCFISFSSKDSKFANKLHNDLQSRGIRCWFAPRDLPAGAKTWDAIDKEITLRDKLIVILSRNSVVSDWVEDEVNKAFAEERRRNSPVLVPIRIDQMIFQTNKPWAQKVKDQRNIADFCRWRDNSNYTAALNGLIRDLALR